MIPEHLHESVSQCYTFILDKTSLSSLLAIQSLFVVTYVLSKVVNSSKKSKRLGPCSAFDAILESSSCSSSSHDDKSDDDSTCDEVDELDKFVYNCRVDSRETPEGVLEVILIAPKVVLENIRDKIRGSVIEEFDPSLSKTPGDAFKDGFSNIFNKMSNIVDTICTRGTLGTLC